MPLVLHTPTTVFNIGQSYSAKYLPTGNANGVFIDVNMVSFEADLTAHSGVAFFCDGVPNGGADMQNGYTSWSGTACGVIFMPDGSIRRESWLGGPGAFALGNIWPNAWQYGVIYRVTATYNNGEVILAVYETDNNDVVVKCVFVEHVPVCQTVVDDVPGELGEHGSFGKIGQHVLKLNTKGSHAAVFCATGAAIATCPMAIYY